MGHRDSSLTRVAPLFDRLYDAGETGAGWLDALVAQGSRADVVSSVPTGQRLVASHGRRWGSAEVALPAPTSLLIHLVSSIDPELVASSKDTGETLRWRRRLASRDQIAIDEALAALRAGRRGRHWFVLEGESKPDALLEATDVVLCVEGKRTEAKCTTTTQWMRTRSQLLRHMDAAMDAFPGKRILGLLIVEGEGGADARDPSEHWRDECRAQYAPSMLEASLPHRMPAERAAISRGILGVTTWQAVCAAVGIEWASLPDVI